MGHGGEFLPPEFTLTSIPVQLNSLDAPTATPLAQPTLTTIPVQKAPVHPNPDVPTAMPPAQVNLTPVQSEPDQLGRPRCQPAKHKLDACLTLQFKEAEEKEVREQEKLLQAQKGRGVEQPMKCQHTK